jgi:hypothetical protein
LKTVLKIGRLAKEKFDYRSLILNMREKHYENHKSSSYGFSWRPVND